MEITSLLCVPSPFFSLRRRTKGDEKRGRGRGRGRERGFEGWYISNVLLTLENNDEAITGFCQRGVALRSIEKAGRRRSRTTRRTSDYVFSFHRLSKRHRRRITFRALRFYIRTTAVACASYARIPETPAEDYVIYALTANTGFH